MFASRTLKVNYCPNYKTDARLNAGAHRRYGNFLENDSRAISFGQNLAALDCLLGGFCGFLWCFSARGILADMAELGGNHVSRFLQIRQQLQLDSLGAEAEIRPDQAKRAADLASALAQRNREGNDPLAESAAVPGVTLLTEGALHVAGVGFRRFLGRFEHDARRHLVE